MNRSFRTLGLFSALLLLAGCSDSMHVTNLAECPVFCRVYDQQGVGPDVASDVAPGGQMRVSIPGADSLAGCLLSVSERSETESPTPARTTTMTLEHRGSRRFAIRSTADGLVVGPDLGQKR